MPDPAASLTPGVLLVIMAKSAAVAGDGGGKDTPPPWTLLPPAMGVRPDEVRMLYIPACAPWGPLSSAGERGPVRNESAPQPNSVRSCPGEFMSASGGNFVPPGVALGTSELGLMDRARREANAEGAAPEEPDATAATEGSLVPEKERSKGLGSASNR